ncbi:MULTISPECIES: (d)CMP kinase [Bosea]|uniref:(d)CMP kinase n=1 Tax=Bosea TaxID=85413 RepID=UPI00214FE809|nr:MULTISPECIES: (d)CMP kinase [Bosea]MCR4523226.1 (d)CMP kinase [Bosea sp. 47.2.35]MDR6830218.1 cytidylate kinase [Bosea robiniae]MDR6895550.1 cytidylate kinase [Bosea sp. BE109]MDR7138946.1 cytidylate kinase [Bosea sp. BE168]MDR7175647.1 cytidylate kinase [Bosea sp. BE271]
MSPARSGRLVIAVDGPAASGKGTLARRLAAHYGLPYLDTGLLYRMVARAMLDAGHDIHDAVAAEAIVGSFDETAFPEERLRGREIGEAASVVAAMPAVRAGLLTRQRRFAAQSGGAVLDGRDIGTVICPEAPAKLFVTATPEVRAARRHKELVGRGETVTFDGILADIRRRDARDSGRSDAPLKAAEDAVVLDTSALTVEEAAAAAIGIVEGRRAA